MANRIQYIDAMRGFSMLLVVVGHIYTFSFNHLNTYVGSFFIPFNMPLFFFISGYLTYKDKAAFTHGFYMEGLMKKCKLLIFPTVIFFVLHYSLFGYDPVFHFLSYGFGKYWFTFVLFEFVLVYYSVKRVANIFRFEEIIPIVFLVVVCLATTIVDFQGNIFFRICRFREIVAYFPYFSFGLLCKRYSDVFNGLITMESVKAFLTFSFVMLLAVYFGAFFSSDSVFSKLNSLFFLRAISLLFVLSVFIGKKVFFSRDNLCSKLMKLTGRRTLDVYMLHYFFLPSLPAFGLYFEGNDNVVLEMVVVIAIAILVIAISLLISEVIRNSRFWGKALFGVN